MAGVGTLGDRGESEGGSCRNLVLYVIYVTDEIPELVARVALPKLLIELLVQRF